MKVLKFGGTSVGTASSIRNVKEIVSAQEGSKVLVLSAMSGVTNILVQLIEDVKEGKQNQVRKTLEELHKKHIDLAEELISAPQDRKGILERLEQLFQQLRAVTEKEYRPELDAVFLTFGETFLTFIFSSYLKAEGISNTLLDAKEFMHVHNLEHPDVELIGSHLQATLNQFPKTDIYITQGFVRKDEQGQISTLKRGGSDYSATIIAAALDAREVQIWTDIDGFHNNDPRVVENTTPLAHLSFEEAAELAYFGAKILHPQTVAPAKEQNIPIFLKNTFHPEAMGTLISSELHKTGLKAISAKDGITAIKIKSNRMLMAHGFLKKIFEVFDTHRTPIDMITTSEIAISLTIDDVSSLDAIQQELKQYGEISIDRNHSIICIVGEEVIDDHTSPRIFEILNEIPVRMISYGGSNNNISLLVDTRNKNYVLQRLHTNLFDTAVVAQLN